MTDTPFATAARLSHAARPGIADFTSSHAARNDWLAAPIEPSWILAGNPVAEYIPVGAGRDGFSTMTLWRCTEGRFRWTFGWEESVYITEGEVEVRAADGRTARLEPGSVALFQAGTTSIWTVRKPVQKMAVCRRALSPGLSRLIRFVRRPWSLPAFVLCLAEQLSPLEPLLIA